MHTRNRYRQPYDLDKLARRVPQLSSFFVTTPDGRISIDFAHADAVRQLNRALLLCDYGLDFWDIAEDSLCPGVPGRLDYVHAIADILGLTIGTVSGLDIGTGSSLIYPILGVREYGWRFVATDIDPVSVRGAEAIVEFNQVLRGRVEVRRQPNPAAILRGIIRPTDHFTFTMCNPPFFASAAEAEASAKTKWTKLGRSGGTSQTFGGRNKELWTEGGEEAFVARMIRESKEYRKQVGWFTTLVSQEAHVAAAKRVLAKAAPTEQRVLQMTTGNKRQRILAWRWKA